MTAANAPGAAPADRRHTVRRTPDATEPIAQVRLRAGRALAVLDVSNGGALVEGRVRLLPGTHVDVHVITPAGRVLVRSRVSRASVSILAADTVTYRGALIFDRGIDTSGYAIPGTSTVSPPAGGIEYPAPPAAAIGSSDDTAFAQERQGGAAMAPALVTPAHPLASEVPCRS
jgi:hypothetical protein